MRAKVVFLALKQQSPKTFLRNERKILHFIIAIAL